MTDLTLAKPKREFLKTTFKYSGANALASALPSSENGRVTLYIHLKIILGLSWVNAHFLVFVCYKNLLAVVYVTCVRSAMVYGSETWEMNVEKMQDWRGQI